MSPHRPEIFVSATSQDLRTCRQLIKEALLTLGCVPIEQTNFPPDARTVREMLRVKITACDAVVHVAGEADQAQLKGPRSSPPAESDTLDAPPDEDRGTLHNPEPTSPWQVRT